MQAIANAAAEEDEFVKEFLINERKYPFLIEDLLTTELWREKIFTQFVTCKFEPKITFPVYMVVSRYTGFAVVKRSGNNKLLL